MKKTFVIVSGLSWLLNVGGLPALGMDRWAALSLLESGNNDAAVGRAGEVTRFQIKPLLWAQFCPSGQLAARTNPQLALSVARAIMNARCAEFVHRYHRSPTNFEYYVLWNAPGQVEKPNRAVARRARRFCNLVGS